MNVLRAIGLLAGVIAVLGGSMTLAFVVLLAFRFKTVLAGLALAFAVIWKLLAQVKTVC